MYTAKDFEVGEILLLERTKDYGTDFKEELIPAIIVDLVDIHFTVEAFSEIWGSPLRFVFPLISEYMSDVFQNRATNNLNYMGGFKYHKIEPNW